MNTKSKQLQENYNYLISTLSGLNVEELLLLYIEAKTGDQKDIGNVPVSILESINELGTLLSDFYDFE